MFCESWRETLGAAALHGEEPSREAGSHLSACGACRVAFAHEEQLFAWIDGGVHSVANAEAPSSLLPRVRVAIADQPVVTNWRLPVWAFAGAALLVIAGIAYEWPGAPHPAALPQSVAALAPAQISSPQISNPQFVASASRPSASPRITSVRAVSVRREPEVLVSGDEQANLLLYLNRRRARNVNNAALQVILTSDVSIKPLEIVRLDVPELTIKPLEDGDSR